ncbi:MAG: hypothetical protein M3Y57_23795 [Acidobacteriota bacterium]|nr:hypothetical protein [Acidobacteriota bacterium]
MCSLTALSLLFVGALGVCNIFAVESPPGISAAEIMKKVAENQDREQKERVSFIYEESVRVATRRSNGKLAREELTNSLVTPTPHGIEKKRESIKGRYWYKGRYIDFGGDPVPNSDTLDGGLTSSFRDGLTNGTSKDGIGKHLFPLTSDEQKDLKFELAGEETVSGRKAFHIRFAPKDKADFAWAGEAFIDKDEFQPIWVYTHLSRRIPFLVRDLLGTDVPGLGFNTRYARIDKDVWFPVSFGTEFRLRAVFFINRTITVSIENKNFRRAVVDSQVHYGNEP